MGPETTQSDLILYPEQCRTDIFLQCRFKPLGTEDLRVPLALAVSGRWGRGRYYCGSYSTPSSWCKAHHEEAVDIDEHGRAGT
ncbi:hypothetical protein NQ317_017944, partial [Molorchus minor]